MEASIINELTFFLSNQAGELAKITKSLAEGEINIKGLLVSEGFGKSVVRLVVSEEKKAMDILEGLGIDDITVGPILAVMMPSKTGVLSEISERLGKSNLNIENIYVTESISGDTMAYVSVADTEEALRVFEG